MSSSSSSASSLLTLQHIQDFKREGVVVVDNVYSAQEIQAIRTAFHAQLSEDGHDHNNSNEKTIRNLPRVGCSLHYFYRAYKLRVALSKRIYDIVTDLYEATFSSGTEQYHEHPFGAFNPKHCFAYIDRIAYRAPDSILVEGGLPCHVDRNPYAPFDNVQFFRPIQASLALTDHLDNESGGLMVVKGFHKESDQYFQRHRQQMIEEYGESGDPLNNVDVSNGNQFHRLKPSMHQSLIDRLEHVNHPAGSLVLWNNALPHATSPLNCSTGDSRETLFTGFLPDVPCNRAFAATQAKLFRSNKAPNSALGKTGVRGDKQKDYKPDALAKKLLALEKW